MVSLVNPQFAIFREKRCVSPGVQRFFYILPKESPLLWKKTHLFSIAF